MTNQNNEKSKNGKRLALILIALLLIVAVAFGAYTYSKYVSRQNGTGSATVAMWGFNVSISDTENMGYSEMYKNDLTATDNVAEAVIKSENKVVAPNSKGSLTFSFGGKAEVNAKITAALSGVEDVFLELKNADEPDPIYYRPIKWTISGGSLSGTSDQLSDFVDDISGLTKEVAAGKDETTTTYTLSWEWAFDATDLTSTESYTIDGDDLDTLLGRLAAAEQPVTDFTGYTAVDTKGATWKVSDYNITSAFSLSIAIEQINSVVSGQGN